MASSEISIVSIATNNYLNFYYDLIISFQNVCPEFSKINFCLFTNRTDDARKFAENHGFSNIVIIEIPNLGWPDASLLRYKIFFENKDVLNSDILVYLDADMLILRDPIRQFKSANEQMTFIRHPGYYFEFTMRFLKYAARNPRKILSFILSLIKFGGIGSWDVQRFSAAYVERQKRNHYFCGGVWFSKNSTFLNFCELLAERTNLGLKQNYVPIWHDESYLNWFAAGHTHNELSPLFCSDKVIDGLFVEKPYLRAVEKPIKGFHGK
jgi:hypothetical protein